MKIFDTEAADQHPDKGGVKTEAYIQKGVSRRARKVRRVKSKSSVFVLT
jgi:hypothetical protein